MIYNINMINKNKKLQKLLHKSKQKWKNRKIIYNNQKNNNSNQNIMINNI